MACGYRCCVVGEPTSEEVLAALVAVCDGTATAAFVGATAREVYAGNVEYALSNGWGVTVFNDCGEWDYIDSIKAPGGEWINLWPSSADYNANAAGHPEAMNAHDRWIPVREWCPRDEEGPWLWDGGGLRRG